MRKNAAEIIQITRPSEAELCALSYNLEIRPEIPYANSQTKVPKPKTQNNHHHQPILYFPPPILLQTQ